MSTVALQEQFSALSELNRLASDSAVQGVLCVDRRDRSIVHSTLDQSRSEALSASVLTALSALEDLDDDAQLVRIRLKKQEILAAPRDNFVLIVLSGASGPTVAAIKHA